MTPEDAQKNIYINIAVTREMLETLLKRGKPASVADLQTLMASVEAKSRPTYTLPAKEVADALAPQLLPLVPTHATLVQAGEQSAVRMEAAIKAGTKDSVKTIQAAMQSFVTTLEDTSTKISFAASESAAKYEKATAAAPTSLPVSFTDNWRWPAGLMGLSVVVTLLLSWSGGAFRGVSQTDYKMVYNFAKRSTEERDAYQAQVRAFRRDMSERKDAKVFTKLAKDYFPPIGLDTMAAK